MNHLHELRELIEIGTSGIDQNGISELRHLHELDAARNPRIANSRIM